MLQLRTLAQSTRARYAVAVTVLVAAVLTLVVALLAPASAEPVPAQQSWGATRTCTTDVAGYCTVGHPAGVVPDAVFVTPALPAMVAVDQLTAATFRVRFARAVAAGGQVTPLTGARTFFVHVDWTPGSSASPAPTTTGPAPTTGAPSPTASPSLSPTPSPTPTFSPSPTPTAGAGCALPEYPTPACTGVPAGTTFVNTVAGEYHVTTAGAVIDRWHVTGALLVEADNVTITNSKIEGGVFNQFGDGTAGRPIVAHPYTITDSTLGPDAPGCSRIAGLQSGNYTATRVLIQGVDHGIDASEPGHVLMRDSFVKLCTLAESHVDGIQSYCPVAACPDVQLLHNTMWDPTHNGTFVVNFKDPNVSGVVVRDNLLYGGDNYVIVAQWRSGADWVFSDNRVVNATWGGAAAASAEGTCAHQVWTGNTIVTADMNAGHVTSTVAPLGCID